MFKSTCTKKYAPIDTELVKLLHEFEFKASDGKFSHKCSQLQELIQTVQAMSSSFWPPSYPVVPQFYTLLHTDAFSDSWIVLKRSQAISFETNCLVLMFKIHMNENLCSMSLSQGQDSDTLEGKGNDICFMATGSFHWVAHLHQWPCRHKNFPLQGVHCKMCAAQTAKVHTSVYKYVK